jgi:hypothetical protein
MMNSVQVNSLLNNLVPNINDIPDIARLSLLERWEEGGMDVVNPPTIDMEAGTWTFHEIEDVLDWKIIKTFGDVEYDIKAIILSFLMECKEDYSMRNFFDMTFDQLSLSIGSLFYEGNRIYDDFQPYHGGLKNIFANDLQQIWKMPVYKLEFLPNHFGTRFYGKQTVQAAINNYITGSSEETPMYIIKAKDYAFDKAKDTLVCGSVYHHMRHELEDIDNLGLLDTAFYLMYRPKPPVMWEEYKEVLLQRGLPQSYADRISQTQRDQLVNFGFFLTPKMSYDQKWQLIWKCTTDYCHLGILDLKLEPLELSLPPRKKRRGEPQLTQQQRALAEIAPSYYLQRCTIVDCSENKKSVNNPRYVTRKDTPARRWEGHQVLWTGKAKYHRTWFYETRRHGCGTITYIPEGKMNQKRYINRMAVCGCLKTKVMPARQPACLKTIFTVGI